MKEKKSGKRRELQLEYTVPVSHYIIPGITIAAGGKRKERLLGIIDTGANCSMISSKISKELTLKPFVTSAMKTAGSEIGSTDNYRIDRFSIAGCFRFSDIIVGNFGEFEFIDVVIGLDILSKLNIEITHRGRKTIITLCRTRDPSNGLQMPQQLLFPPLVKIDGKKTFRPYKSSYLESILMGLLQLNEQDVKGNEGACY